MNAKASVSKELNTRHTKILEGLLKLPENKQCADCKSKGPRWASINLGIFICLQCSGIHRSLGVHISQVRSATLDTWLPEQVAFMQRMGNEKANNYWEAELPPDHSRDQHGIEAFIHSKYKEKRWVPRDEKSTSSSSPTSKAEEEEEEEEARFEKNQTARHRSKEPRSASEMLSIIKIIKMRHKSAGSSSSSKHSTRKTTHEAAPNDTSITSAPSVPSHQQQEQVHTPPPVRRLTHQRSMSDSHAMSATITTQSWVNFDYDDPEDTALRVGVAFQ